MTTSFNLPAVQLEFSEHVDYRKKPGLAIIEDLNADKADLLHMVVGLVGETNELEENFLPDTYFDAVNFVEEVGDLKYYLVGAKNTVVEMQEDFTTVGFSPVYPETDLELCQLIKREAITALDFAKGICIYGKTDVKPLEASLFRVDVYVNKLLERNNVSLDFVLKENIKKLSKRYPNGYTNKKAISRDDKIGTIEEVQLEEN